MVKVIRKVGGSYYVILPKGQTEFFDWNESPVYIERFNSEELVIKKLNVKISPSTWKQLKKLRNEKV